MAEKRCMFCERLDKTIENALTDRKHNIYNKYKACIAIETYRDRTLLYQIRTRNYDLHYCPCCGKELNIKQHRSPRGTNLLHQFCYDGTPKVKKCDKSNAKSDEM